MSELDSLHAFNWIPLPNTSYIIKYLFHNTGYNVLVSNLTLIYGEKFSEADVQKMNPYAEMKSRVILENLKKSLQQCLVKEANLNMNLEQHQLILTLHFPAAHVECNYDIKMDLLPPNQIMHHIIGPTIMGALLSEQKVVELQKKILTPDGMKITSSSKSTLSIKNVIEPEWLIGKNVPAEKVLESFLKIQSHFSELRAENNEAHSILKKEKAECVVPVYSTISQKKCISEENTSNESVNIKFEDDKGNTSIKIEETSSIPVEPRQIPVKRKRIIKF